MQTHNIMLAFFFEAKISLVAGQYIMKTKRRAMLS